MRKVAWMTNLSLQFKVYNAHVLLDASLHRSLYLDAISQCLSHNIRVLKTPGHPGDALMELIAERGFASCHSVMSRLAARTIVNFSAVDNFERVHTDGLNRPPMANTASIHLEDRVAAQHH